jgi:hypothetical protein
MEVIRLLVHLQRLLVEDAEEMPKSCRIELVEAVVLAAEAAGMLRLLVVLRQGRVIRVEQRQEVTMEGAEVVQGPSEVMPPVHWLVMVVLDYKIQSRDLLSIIQEEALAAPVIMLAGVQVDQVEVVIQIRQE